MIQCSLFFFTFLFNSIIPSLYYFSSTSRKGNSLADPRKKLNRERSDAYKQLIYMGKKGERKAADISQSWDTLTIALLVLISGNTFGRYPLNEHIIWLSSAFH